MRETYETPLTYWESVTLYQLVKNQYCDIVDALRPVESAREVLKDYGKLMRKLEAAIANLHDPEAEG